MSLKVTIGDIEFKNPIIGASGTVAYGKELAKHYDLSLLGGISVKGMTIEPRPGNKGIIYYPTPSGLMNSVGLKNPSVGYFVERIYPHLRKYNLNIIANTAGSTIEDYLKVIEQLNRTDLPIIELNISCPNVKEGGMAFGIKCDTAREIVTAARNATDKHLMVKLSPNAENIQDMAVTCVEAGANSLSLINTMSALAIDVHKKKAVFNNVTAGLSGPAIRPIALRMVRDVAQVVDVPIVGIGGIENYEHVLAFIMAGATAVQVGSANHDNPMVMPEIIKDLENYMEREGLQSLEDIRGII